MSYGGGSLGSIPYGGTSGGGDNTVFPSTLTLSFTLLTPLGTPVIATPATLAATVTVNSPTIIVTALPATQTLTITAETPSAVPGQTVAPATLTSTLALNAPLVIVTAQPSTLALTANLHTPAPLFGATPATLAATVTVNAPVPVVSNLPSTLALTGAVNAPTPIVAANPATLTATLTVNAPTIQVKVHANLLFLDLTKPWNLMPTIVHYIKDPIANGGCPQCGTFLYKEYGAHEIKSEAVYRGRSFDISGEDTFIRCSRCDFPVKVKRHPPHPIGSWTGWGLRYDEVESGSSSISYP